MASKQEEEREKRWQKMYQQLMKFKSELGHTRVPSTWHNATLAKWVTLQRKNEDLMPPVRKKKMQAIGFSWHRDMQEMEEQLWETKYEWLKIFYKEHGHWQVPSTDAYYYSLHIWANIQRRKEKILPSHRKKKLDAIGFRWSKNIKSEATRKWSFMFNQLRAYHQKHGNFSPKKDTPLNKWVQRHRNRWAQLDKNQRKKLEEIGFVTSGMIEKEKRQKWLTMLSQLKRYKKNYGHCRVPYRFKDNAGLGRWVSIQRMEEKNMPSWRKEKLDELGFDWSDDIKTDMGKKWYAMYDKLEKFYKRFGHSAVPEYWKEDPQLSMWVLSQRRPKKPLSSDKINLLKQVKFLWSPSKERKRTRDKSGRFAMELGS